MRVIGASRADDRARGADNAQTHADAAAAVGISPGPRWPRRPSRGDGAGRIRGRRDRPALPGKGAAGGAGAGRGLRPTTISCRMSGTVTATTQGTGEVIRAGLDRLRRIILGVGATTTHAGTGMARSQRTLPGPSGTRTPPKRGFPACLDRLDRRHPPTEISPSLASTVFVRSPVARRSKEAARAVSRRAGWLIMVRL